MASSPTALRTPYDRRVSLVADTIKAHSKLNEKDSAALAVRVLAALNSIPEEMR